MARTTVRSAYRLLLIFGIVSTLPTLTDSQCTGNVQADMVFVLDASGSVGSGNFQTMLSFVNDLINDFDIASDKVRVGVQKFSSSTNTEFNLNTYYDKNAIMSAVSGIYYTQGGTNTGDALAYLRTNMFTSGNGDRANVPNLGIILTDGRSNSYSETATQAANARNAGITIFSIGIGSGIPVGELNEMATDPDSDHVFAVSSFSALAGIKSAFQAQACPAVDGGWSSYGSYGSCSVTCGGGTYSRTRSCTNPAPSNGGADCSGSDTDTSSCNTQGCPVDGGWGNWGSYGGCSVTCGGGTKTRSRNCDNPSRANGGADCSGSSTDSASCNTHSCPIDGVWGQWGAYGSCTVSCGGGTKVRTRACDSPARAHGGADCPGSSSDTGTCNTHPCPIDGYWSSWQTWGSCSVTCKAVGTRQRTRLCNNPPAQHGGAECTGQSSGGDTDIESCDYRLTLCEPGNGWAPQVYETTAGTPVNGGFNNWSAWSACTKTCGAGVRVRMRQCNNPVPQYGGTLCSGDYVEKEFCNNVACSPTYNYVQTCPERYFSCQNQTLRQCVHYLKKCDCVNDCGDYSDEMTDYAGCTSHHSTCFNTAATVLGPALLIISLMSASIAVLFGM